MYVKCLLQKIWHRGVSPTTASVIMLWHKNCKTARNVCRRDTQRTSNQSVMFCWIDADLMTIKIHISIDITLFMYWGLSIIAAKKSTAFECFECLSKSVLGIESITCGLESSTFKGFPKYLYITVENRFVKTAENVDYKYWFVAQEQDLLKNTRKCSRKAKEFITLMVLFSWTTDQFDTSST